MCGCVCVYETTCETSLTAGFLRDRLPEAELGRGKIGKISFKTIHSQRKYEVEVDFKTKCQYFYPKLDVAHISLL